MLLFASCIILKRQVGPSVAVLAGVIIGQAIAYGLVFDSVCLFIYLFTYQHERTD
jgi:hypothetical protein